MRVQMLPSQTAPQISPQQTQGVVADGGILDRVRGLVAGVLGSRAPARPILDDDSLAEIGVASIDMVTLLLSLEREFDFEVPQADITPETFRSVATLAALVRRCRSDIPQA